MSGLRAMDQMGVDVAVFQETKVTHGVYPRSGHGYSVFAADTSRKRCGGVALVWRDCDSCAVEEQKSWGANVLSCHLITGRGKYYLIGAYCPPSDLDDTAIQDVQRAWGKCPKGYEPLLLGDLNANIESPKSRRDVAASDQAAGMDVHDMSRCFRQRRRNWVRGRWTWRKLRRGRMVSSHPDYLFSTGGDEAANHQLHAAAIPHP